MVSKKIGFNGLKAKVAKEYEKKGDAPKTAQKIGAKVAGKVAKEKGK